jgi:hypothetical protein
MVMAGLMMAACQKEMPVSQIEVYFELLNDIPANILRPAVLRALAESDQNFIPAVGMLRRLAAEAQFGVIPSWGTEWERVLRSVRKLGRDRQSEAFEFLGPLTARITGQIGWETICNSETIGVQMAMFRSLYEASAQHETNQRRLAVELRPVVSRKMLTVAEPKRLAVNS